MSLCCSGKRSKNPILTNVSDNNYLNSRIISKYSIFGTVNLE